jgi:hypothetical protein
MQVRVDLSQLHPDEGARGVGGEGLLEKDHGGVAVPAEKVPVAAGKGLLVRRQGQTQRHVDERSGSSLVVVP